MGKGKTLWTRTLKNVNQSAAAPKSSQRNGINLELLGISLWLFSAHTGLLSPLWELCSGAISGKGSTANTELQEPCHWFRQHTAIFKFQIPYPHQPKLLFFSLAVWKCKNCPSFWKDLKCLYCGHKFDSNNQIMISEYQILKKDGFKLSQFEQVKILQTTTAFPPTPQCCHSSNLRSSKTLQGKPATFLLFFLWNSYWTGCSILVQPIWFCGILLPIPWKTNH